MIGFFDSGLGGLTILAEVQKRLPGTYLYLGDNARAPYGSRSQAEILQFTIEGVKWLIEQGCSLVILACNTASANALRTIQQDWLPKHAPDARVLGVLVPTVEAITGLDWSNQSQRANTVSVLLFATPSTVASGAYEREIHKRLPQASVISVACPTLVPLIEAGAAQGVLQTEIKKYYEQGISMLMHEPDVVLLGCTHYALLERPFKALFSSSTTLLSQPAIVTKALQSYLVRHPEHAIGEGVSTSYYTTADPQGIGETSRRFMPTIITYQRVEH